MNNPLTARRTPGLAPVRSWAIPGILAAICFSFVAVGCNSDPYQNALNERARWTVELRSWTQSPEDGRIVLDSRVIGPPNASIEQLTFRVRFFNESEAVLGTSWHTIDLQDVPRGGPKDMIFRFEPPGVSSGVAIDLVLRPDEAERKNIPELQF